MSDVNSEPDQSKSDGASDNGELEISFEFGMGKFHIKGQSASALEAADRMTDNLERITRGLATDYNIVNGYIVQRPLVERPVDAPLLNSGEQPIGEIQTQSANGNGANDLTPIERFAELLGVSVEVLNGSCEPSIESPYLRLNKRNCKIFWGHFPAERGPSAMSPIILPATLMALWFDTANLSGLTIIMANELLTTVGESRVDHPTRTLEKRDWLWPKNDGSLALVGSKRDKAIAVARAFCLEEPPKLDL